MSIQSIPITSKRDKTGQDWPAPVDIGYHILTAIMEHDRANPDRRFPVEAMTVIRKGIREAVREHTGGK